MNRYITLIIAVIFFFSITVCVAQTNRQLQPLKIQTTAKLKTFKPVTAVMIKKPVKAKLNLIPLKPAQPVKPTGPDPNAAVDLADMIDDPDLLEDISFACGWDPHLIFQDKTAGNVFYYLPKAFLLLHDSALGYQLNVQYNNMTDPSKPSVMLTAELAAPHQSGDIQLLKQILKQAFELKAADKLILKSISGIGAVPDMHGLTAGLLLEPARVSVSLPAHFKQPFRLTLLLTPDETEEVLAQISREGLTGSLNVKVGENAVPVPIHIRYSAFAGSRVDGFAQWVDNQPKGHLQNVTSFPVEIDSINCYRIKNNRLERISKKLKPVTLSPEKKKAFRIPAAAKLLGSNVLLAWLGTTLDVQCENCIKNVDKNVRKGVAAAMSTPLKFEAIPDVFSDFELYKVIVQVQSPYFAPNSTDIITKEVELTQDDHINQTLLVYPPEDKGPEPLLYKYKLMLITTQGETLSEEDWHNAKNSLLFFGARQIEPVMGEVEE